jgi:glycosyltransferase involved in cell wall biosynthesis
MVTGFGKNMRNLLLALHNDPDIEVIEAANGVPYGADLKTPWKCYGTAPSDPNLMNEIGNDGMKQRMASYGYYCIDKIIEECKPDIYLGIEDIWAFKDFEKKPWWNTLRTIIWTTLDSVPILPDAFHIAPKCDEFIVWASFAEQEMKKNGFQNVKTIHGAIDYSDFKPLAERDQIRSKFNINEDFVIGFVFKNQLRKSVPNLLDGFRLFKEKNPKLKTKLLLHTDWSEVNHGWDIPRYIKEKNINEDDVLASYICHQCGEFFLHKYIGEKKDCPSCGAKERVHTKNSGLGVSEDQLNQIYSCMDVYCHPFTSGGQELPIQEAKAAGLITLVTEYSCGTDSCYPHQGGLPLKWNEYREPHTQFIKATTCPQDICEKLDKVLKMSFDEKQSLIQNGKKTVNEKFSVQKIKNDLKQIFVDLKNKNKEIIVNEEVQKQQTISFESLLDKNQEDRILIVMPESAGDVFMLTSLLPSIKEAYPEKDLYFATKKEFFPILDLNEFIYKIIEYNPFMENLVMMEGRSDHQGYFQICFLPHIGTQRQLDYLHQGNKDKIMFEIHSENYNKY